MFERIINQPRKIGYGQVIIARHAGEFGRFDEFIPFMGALRRPFQDMFSRDDPQSV